MIIHELNTSRAKIHIFTFISLSCIKRTLYCKQKTDLGSRARFTKPSCDYMYLKYCLKKMDHYHKIILNGDISARSVITFWSSHWKRRFTSNISQKFMVSPLALHFELSHNRCYRLQLLVTALFTQVQLLLIWPLFRTNTCRKEYIIENNNYIKTKARILSWTSKSQV